MKLGTLMKQVKNMIKKSNKKWGSPCSYLGPFDKNRAQPKIRQKKRGFSDDACGIAQNLTLMYRLSTYVPEKCLLLRFSQTCEFWSSKAAFTTAFFAAVNHLNGPLGKQNFILTGSKGHGLWFVIGGFRSILCVCVFQGSLPVIVTMIDGSMSKCRGSPLAGRGRGFGCGCRSRVNINHQI